MDYISREDAFNAIDALFVKITNDNSKTITHYDFAIADALQTITDLPVADVIERNTLQHVESVKNALDVPETNVGKWEKYGEDMQVCSACHKYWIWAGEMYDFKYCPNCGAKMEGNE